MLNINLFTDFVLGDCHRRIESPEKTIYLTFDDGPNSYCTPLILDLLKKHNAKATFFLIGNNIEKNVHIFNRINNEGHAIGNHSPDHNTINFVKGKKALAKWIKRGESSISAFLKKPSVGFRPPVGIRTPELNQIMKETNSKPIMWQHRFYDTTFEFNDVSWKRKLSKIKSGDIILLHDTHQQPSNFILSLENFIKHLNENDFQLKEIPML